MRTIFFSILFGVAAVAAVASANDNWPEFRGPGADGKADSAKLPLTWSETEHVKWKTPIPHKGWCSPVVFGDQVWVTSATDDGKQRFIYCVDKNTGKVLHEQTVFETEHPDPLGNDVNSYASPSPVIEAGRVYLHFGSYGTMCVDTKSFSTLWERHDLPCNHYRGPASSPVLFGDLIILTFDGSDYQYLAALDKNTGKTIWKTDRSTNFGDIGADGKPEAHGDWRKYFGTPLVVQVNGKPQLISPGSKAVFAYDPLTGKEIWTVRHQGHSGSSRTLFGHGLVYVMTGNGKTELLAIRPDGAGDVTDTHVAWRTSKGVPSMPSGVLIDDQIYMVSDAGVATSLDAKTGNVLWQQRVGGQFCASILAAPGRLYFLNRDGAGTVLATGPEAKVLGTSKLDDGFMSSPAAAGDALFLRTKTNLYRIEE